MHPLKTWLDTNVIPLLTLAGAETRLKLYSLFWNGNPPTDVLVFLTVDPPQPDAMYEASDAVKADPDGEAGGFGGFAALGEHLAKQEGYLAGGVRLPPSEAWATATQRLLTAGFRFDFLRDVMMVKMDTGVVPIFGGDGAPIISNTGMVSVRLWQKIEGVHLILQVGVQLAGGIEAADCIKAFFKRFEDDPMTVCTKFAAPFGAA